MHIKVNWKTLHPICFLNLPPTQNSREALHMARGMDCTIHLLEIIRLSDFSSPLFYPSLLGVYCIKNTLSSSATARKVSSWVCLTLTSPRYMKSRTAPSSAYGASINQPQFFYQPILLRFYPNLCSNRNIAYLRATQVEEGGGGGSARGFWRRICLKSRVTDTYLIYPIWIRTQIQIHISKYFDSGSWFSQCHICERKKIQINISSNNKMWKRSLFKMVFHTFFVADPDFFPSCPNLVNIAGTTTWK